MNEKQILEELQKGALKFSYRDIIVYAHEHPDGDEWTFIWIGGRNNELGEVLKNIDQLLLSGYTPGHTLPCKNCSKHVQIKLFEEIPGLSSHEHVDGHYYCHDDDILPSATKPVCHICGVEKPPHNQFCSAGGTPQHRAEPKSLTRSSQAAIDYLKG